MKNVLCSVAETSQMVIVNNISYTTFYYYKRQAVTKSAIHSTCMLQTDILVETLGKKPTEKAIAHSPRVDH